MTGSGLHSLEVAAGQHQDGLEAFGQWRSCYSSGKISDELHLPAIDALTSGNNAW